MWLGVRQGYLLPPWLFNVYLDMVVVGSKDTVQRRSLPGQLYMQLLMFADDTVLLAQTKEDLQCSIRELSASEAVKWHRLHGD